MAYIVKAHYYANNDQFGESFVVTSDHKEKDLRIEVGKKVKIIPLCNSEEKTEKKICIPSNYECERSIDKESLKQIEKDEIIGVELFGGGDKSCHAIEIKFKSGKFLIVEKEIDISSYGIFPCIKYNIGSWGEVKINKKECNGQLFFNFFNKS